MNNILNTIQLEDKTTNITYAVFGSKIEYHQQVQFSILSFLALKKTSIKVIVLTDHPEFYKNIESVIEIIPISSKTLEEWKGKHNFFWRIKILSIKKVAEQYPDNHLIYLDGDTFFYKDFDKIKSMLDDGKVFMHKKESRLKGSSSGTQRKMFKQLKGKTVLKQYPITDKTEMWNAGVIGISSKNLHYLEEILKVNDELLDIGVTPRLIEQFSFSLVLNHKIGLNKVDDQVIHYWSTKDEWNELISNFFATCYFEKRSYLEILIKLSEIELYKIPIHKRIPSWNNRIIKWTNKLFKTKNITFLKK